MTIQTNTVTINGTQYKHTYSTTGYMITRNDNKQFVEAYDPTNSSYTYTESTTLALQSLGARLSALETAHDALEALPHIIETGTSKDGLSWYKLYSDKCCIQGGRIAGISNANTTITFIKPYKNNNYFVYMGQRNDNQTSDTYNENHWVYKQNTNNMLLYNSRPANGYIYWKTIGYIN